MSTRRQTRILIVDDDPEVRWVLSTSLEMRGYNVLTAQDGKEALQRIRKTVPGAVLLDVRLPGMDGLEVLERVREIDLNLPVVVMSAYDDTQRAVKAMKLGAYDYLSKPFDDDVLAETLKRAHETIPSVEHVPQSLPVVEGWESFQKKIGTGVKVRELLREGKRVAPTDFSVLIQGESGTGKQLVAEAIHIHSGRVRAPFVVIDCGAIPETLFESELFGYDKGAFTGASKRKGGFFEAANGGTLLLDEIGNLPKTMQMKLLGVTENKRFTHLGGTDVIDVDVRILCASNKDLLQAVDREDFRRDLYYRLAEFTIQVPPLRDRREDILYLADLFLRETGKELHKSLDGFAKEVKDILLDYDWPGNVRELRNVVRQSVLNADRLVTLECLPRHLARPDGPDVLSDYANRLLDKGYSWKEMKKSHQRQLEKKVFAKVLKEAQGNMRKASEKLGMDYKTFRTRVKKLAIKSG